MLLVSLFVSAGFVFFVAHGVAKDCKRENLFIAFILCLLAVAGAMVIGGLGLAVTALGVGALAVVCWIFTPRPAVFKKGSYVVLAVAFLLLICVRAIPHLHRIARYRQQYPLESLVDRLAYETRSLSAASSPQQVAENSPEVLDRLAETEGLGGPAGSPASQTSQLTQFMGSIRCFRSFSQTAS
jgi:K+-sensing histidine kinase KdpD